MTPGDLQVGDFLIHPTGERHYIANGQTASRVAANGVAEVFDVVGRGAHVKVGVVSWINGEQDVRQLSREKGLEPVDRLTDRLRISIKEYGEKDWCEVVQVCVNDKGRVTWRKASLEEIDAGAGISSKKVLGPLGASIGTREELRHEDGSHRSFLCVVFPAEERIVPVAVFVMSRLAPLISAPPEPDAVLEIRGLVAQGESAKLEFKASSRWDSKLKEQNKALHGAIVKTVAGFANSKDGGVLLIGVSDEGLVVGLAEDFKLCGRGDADGFENWLMTLLITRIGKVEAAEVRISMVQVDDQYVCLVRVGPSDHEVFDKDGTESRFWVRMANSTRELNGQEMVDYIERRFR